MASSAMQLAQIAPLSEHTLLLKNMRESLQYTPVKHFCADGSVTVELIKDPYYLDNDTWNMDYFLSLESFRHLKSKRWANMQTQNLRFPFINSNLNLEAKYVFHQMTFSDAWSLSTTFTLRRSALARLAKFINGYKASISSFAEMQNEEFLQDYQNYLAEAGLITYYPLSDRKSLKKSFNFAAPTIIYNHLQRILREQYFASLSSDLWNEDVWDIRYFRKFGLDTPRSSTTKSIVFTGINNIHFRNLLKTYLREKLVTSNIVWSTAHGKSIYLGAFLNFVAERHPDWSDLAQLSRADSLAYLEALSLYANTKLSAARKDANPKHYPKSMLSQVRTFLMELQIMEYPQAPKTPALQLIRYDDTKGYTSTVPDKIKYVPDFVLNQFFQNLSLFPEKYLPVVLTMYYTGLRISDALELKWNCLVQIQENFWVETYIWKTQTLDHRCPITNEFAALLEKYIEESKANSNADNNPEHFIFVHYHGLRKGEPYTSHSVRAALNTYAERAHIVDESGEIFHFKNHAFRHTFSVKMINHGADILTVMQLLAHATPKMTLAYARLFDSTKREAFEKVVKTGAFTFSPSESEPIVYAGDVPQKLLDNLWVQHKLNAVDTPYGTCLQRKNGRCTYAKQPPCLTCNDGQPCKDLCVGVLDSDIEKYDILIEFAQKTAVMARNHDRYDMAVENEDLLCLLQKIRTIIADGGIIYGRSERLLGDTNE